jgi:hypothetical protein
MRFIIHSLIYTQMPYKIIRAPKGRGYYVAKATDTKRRFSKHPLPTKARAESQRTAIILSELGLSKKPHK